MKILIMGAGGVGGYLAGHLAEKYGDITLIARGAQLEAIKAKGLTVYDDEACINTRPALVTDKPADAGVQDAIFICTKSYGLSGAMEQLMPCIGENTLIIPLLNGISARRIIREHTDKGIVLDGCVYIFSQITAPGVIKKAGNLCKIVTGNPQAPNPESLTKLKEVIEDCGIALEISDNISRVMWMKWIVMISNAQAASYYNLTMGPLREDKEKFKLVHDLLDEVLAVAKAEGIDMPKDAKETTLNLIKKFEYDSTPSLARDLNTPGKPTEIGVFAGELCRLADKHGIDVPKNRMVLERFKDRL